MTSVNEFENIDDLYGEIVLDHYRNPRNQSQVNEPDIQGHGFNPFCGDEISLQIKLCDGLIDTVGFQGRGCSISQASTSLMTKSLKGMNLVQALAFYDLFHRLMHGNQLSEEEFESLGDIAALSGVPKYPIRVKCALLGWGVLRDGLMQLDGDES